LFLKPIREIPWAGVLGVVVGAVAAVAASFVLPSTVLGVDEWIILVIIFFIVGAIVHTLLHFLEDVLTIATMVLDWKPTMVIIGLVAVVEGTLLLMDKSIISFF
jgi:tetrahydromethanopterin S-methyltransferase subunit C